MTKADLIESIYAQLKIPKKESQEIVELVLESVKLSLERGESVKVSGFGSFHVREKKRRVGRNPQTGRPMEISARRVLTFRAAQHVRDALNPGHGRTNGVNGSNGAAHRSARAP